MTDVANHLADPREDRRAEKGPQAVFIAGYGESSREVANHLAAMGIQVMAALSTEQCRAEITHAGLVIIGADVVNDPGALAWLATTSSPSGDSRLILLAADKILSFDERLKAARLGSVRLFSPGDDLRYLRDLVRARSSQVRIAGYKVLLVEDSRTDAYMATKYMSEEGMEVKHIRAADMVLDAIHEFQPDVIVSDLHMPGCNGDLMVRVVRQDRDATMPIVFLSSESNEEAKLLALSNGADGFVSKPLSQVAFIAALKSILTRSTALENRMRRDPLTNLLNHRQFTAMVHRAAKSGRLHSLVALDIDYFKRVNDSYGHPVGDRVLVTLAELLTDGLRSADFVGRVGGEEFGILMVDATPEQARAVIDRLRLRFQGTELRTDQNSGFHCTFSAGVAGLDVDTSLSTRAADEALYEAKRSGRNQVVLATSKN